jgi:hypothetical protein
MCYFLYDINILITIITNQIHYVEQKLQQKRKQTIKNKYYLTRMYFTTLGIEIFLTRNGIVHWYLISFLFKVNKQIKDVRNNIVIEIRRGFRLLL